MNLQLSDDQELFRSTTSQFLERNMESADLRRLADRGGGYERSWWRAGAELGWTSLLVPESLGGGSISGNGMADLAIVAEELGRVAAPGPLMVANLVIDTLAQSSSNARHADILSSMLTGESVGTWAVYEPGRGWEPMDPSFVARRRDGGFVLDGTKDRVESGDQAEFFLVGATVDGALTQFVVPADLEGITVTPMWSLDLTRRFSTVVFNNVAIEGDALVGEIGEAGPSILHQRRCAMILQCAETIGATDRVFGMTLQWSFDRIAFGRPLASYQAIKHRFATMKMWLEAMFATTDGAVRGVGLERGSDLSPQVAKIFVSTRSLDIMQDCVQIHGGIGVTWEHDLHIFLRRATVNRALYGTPEEQRAELGRLLSMEQVPA